MLPEEEKLQITVKSGKGIETIVPFQREVPMDVDEI